MRTGTRLRSRLKRPLMPGRAAPTANRCRAAPVPRIGAPGMLLILLAESQGQARPQSSFQIFDVLEVVCVRR